MPKTKNLNHECVTEWPQQWTSFPLFLCPRLNPTPLDAPCLLFISCACKNVARLVDFFKPFSNTCYLFLFDTFLKHFMVKVLMVHILWYDVVFTGGFKSGYRKSDPSIAHVCE